MPIGGIRSLGLTAKLNLVLLAVLVLSLGGAAAVLRQTGRESAIRAEMRQVEALARILASQAEAGMAVADPAFLEELLAVLGREPRVVFAGAYSDRGLLAAHPRGAAGKPPFPRAELPGSRRLDDGDHVEAVVSVVQADRILGSIHIVSNLREAMKREQDGAGTLALVMGGSALLALGLATLLGRLVTRPLVHLAARLRDIAEGQGDLSQRVEAASDDEVGLLGRSFNTFVASVQETVKSIVQNARDLAEASETLHNVSGQMTRDSSDVAAQSQSVSTATEQISANLRSVSDSTRSMASSVQEISRNAEGAAKVATTAVAFAGRASETLERLARSGAEVETVVRLITSVADQTNLLALNATIEAARAGEAGRGFGVVAGEVKELARSTARGAENVRTLLETMRSDLSLAQAAIAEIVRVIHDIHDAQSMIATAVAEQTATTSEIGRTIEESARGGASIVGHIHSVASASRSASDGARRAAQAVGELSRLALALDRAVGRFKI